MVTALRRADSGAGMTGISLPYGDGGVYQGRASKGTLWMTDSDDCPAMPADLPPAAQRALAEAEARRLAAAALDLPPELGGRKGPEPVRYGDWEKKGLAVDF
jgi:hypothetical protein